MPITIDVEKDYLYQIGLEKGIKLERQKLEAELKAERRRVEELERQKAEAEIEAERQKAEAELEAERQKAEAEKLEAIIALYDTGLSISTISQVFRTTEEHIQDIISSRRQEE